MQLSSAGARQVASHALSQPTRCQPNSVLRLSFDRSSPVVGGFKTGTVLPGVNRRKGSPHVGRHPARIAANVDDRTILDQLPEVVLALEDFVLDTLV
jgi:hypothetical protein